MNLIPLSDINEQLGKPSTWNPQTLAGKLIYQYGMPLLDEARESNPASPIDRLSIKIHPQGLVLFASQKFKLLAGGIRFNDLVAVELAAPTQITASGERSVIGRAVLGGLLLGPVGAIVGGLSGLQGGVQHSSSLLTFLIRQGEQEYYVITLVEAKDFVAVRDFLNKNLSQYLR